MKEIKNCAPFINCKSETNNTEIDDAKDIDIVISMFNLIEYSNNYSKTSGSLWQYYRDEPNDNLTNLKSFKCRMKLTGNTPADGYVYVNDVYVNSFFPRTTRLWNSLPIECFLLTYDLSSFKS